MSEPSLSPLARLAVALAMAAFGSIIALAAFDIGPLPRKDINGPPWIALVAGATIILGGASLALGQASRMLSLLLTFAMLAGFAALGNFVAFGPGARACAGSFSIPLLSGTMLTGELTCRAAFGIGAAMLDGLLFFLAAKAAARHLPEGRAAKTVEKTGSAVLLTSLAPILIPLLLFALAASAVSAIRTRLATGSWPRNEAFIARMRAKKRQRQDDPGGY